MGFERFDRSNYKSLGSRSLWRVAQAANVAVNFLLDFTDTFNSKEWQKAARSKYLELLSDLVKWKNDGQIVFYSSSGDFSAPLSDDMSLKFSSSQEAVYVDDTDAFVMRDQFIEGLKKYWEIDANRLTEVLYGQFEKKKEPKVTDKNIVQAVALTLWNEHPDMTQAEIIKHKAIQIHAGGKYMTRENTLRDWLREIDPRDSDKKTGPKNNKI